jgi:hypothetical protein
MHATSESSLTGVKRITDTNVSDYGQALLSTSVIKSLPDKPLPPVASPDDRIEIITEKTSNNFKKNGGGIKQSLQKFGQAASRIIKAWREEGERTVAPNDQVDSQPTPKVKDSSYLLDSYNRTGQYSTLKRDSSLDSHFQAKG